MRPLRRTGRRPAATVGAIAVSLFLLVASRSVALSVHSFTLDNGMTFLVVERDGPLVAAGWSVRWGAGDDVPGRTGAAHFLEHLLFQGTEVIGTRDWTRERLLMAERDALLLAQRDDAEAARLAQLDAELQQVRIPGDYSRVYAEAGALGIDAVTNRDLSVYSLLVPKQRLELWFWMESERLLRPVFRNIEDELRVIEQERLQRLESSPIGPAIERFEERFWGVDHPYSWTSDGRRRDWQGLTAPGELRRIFERAYAPSHLTAALVGDVDLEQVRQLAQLYFGRRRSAAPDTGSPASDAVTLAAGEDRPGSLDETCACRTQVEARYSTVPFSHPDTVVLDVLAGILNGRTGRLHRELVLDRRIAFSATSRHAAWRRAGSFSLFAEALEDEPPERLLAALDEVVSTLREEDVGARELEKVKNQITTDVARQVQEPAALMRRLLVYAGLGDWRRLVDWDRAALAVGPADIERVVRQYLVPERRGEMILRRTAGSTTR
ncbi:MAG TPA: pitrilysin family protein [Thermoanaerobaculia bacterium]|nr:pitrilysin family protein [Thermoanaerobaculia bacterium]